MTTKTGLWIVFLKWLSDFYHHHYHLVFEPPPYFTHLSICMWFGANLYDVECALFTVNYACQYKNKQTHSTTLLKEEFTQKWKFSFTLIALDFIATEEINISGWFLWFFGPFWSLSQFGFVLQTFFKTLGMRWRWVNHDIIFTFE